MRETFSPRKCSNQFGYLVYFVRQERKARIEPVGGFMLPQLANPKG